MELGSQLFSSDPDLILPIIYDATAHFLSGYAIANAIDPKASRLKKLYRTFAVGSAPDIDFGLEALTQGMILHRGPTHTLLGALSLASVGTLLEKKVLNAQTTWKETAAMYATGGLAHLAVDACADNVIEKSLALVATAVAAYTGTKVTQYLRRRQGYARPPRFLPGTLEERSQREAI